MNIWWDSLRDVPSAGPSILAMGIFDGVHLGHRQLLRDVARRAQSQGMRSIALTFHPHPAALLAPHRCPKLLLSLDQRLEVMASLGLDQLWVLPFDLELAHTQAEDFLTQLGRSLNPREIHVGRAFQFGQDRKGDLETLQHWGQSQGCEIHAHAFRALDGGHLSSTRIRQTLEEGKVEEAASLLGAPFRLSGRIVKGERRGRLLGFPTANLDPEQEQLPARGVYLTAVHLDHSQPKPGLTNIGIKPTFQGSLLTLETHLPGFSGDLYGKPMELSFLSRIRNEQAFPGVEALRQQIEKDLQIGLEIWEKKGMGCRAVSLG